MTQQASSSGIGFGGLLAVLFIGLKLTGYIDWSWWWVLGPLWIPFSIVLSILAIVMLFAMSCMLFAKLLDRFK